MQLHRRQNELAARDAVVLAISFDSEPLIQAFCREQPWPFDWLVDGRRTAYQAYGPTRGSWLQTLTARALAPYIRLALRGRAVRAAPGQDIRQGGGDFVVGRDGRLTRVHASDDPTDRPDAASIVEACRWLLAALPDRIMPGRGMLSARNANLLASVDRLPKGERGQRTDQEPLRDRKRRLDRSAFGPDGEPVLGHPVPPEAAIDLARAR